MPDKRYEKRKKKRLSARFGHNEERHIGYTCDVSSEGIRIESKTVYNPGTVLNIELSTNNNSSINFVGEVRWAKKAPPNLARVMKSGMGIHIQQFLGGEEIFRSFFVH